MNDIAVSRWRKRLVVAMVLAFAAIAWSLSSQYRAVLATPVATVVRGSFVDELRVRGEVKPLHSTTVTAPSSVVRIVPAASSTV